MFGHVYTGRRVFVTGHTGFKGSWLTAWLLRLGAEVAGFSDGVPTTPSHYDVLGLADSILDRRGDVRDRAGLGKAMRDFRPEIVFHLAAQPLVRAAYADPAATIETNALGTLNLLEAVRATPSVQAVVCITSDKAYRNDEQVWGYRENDHLGGADPYSASKGCAEIIAHSYFASFFGTGPRCATTRAGNVIGGGDWAADRIVPDCARAWFAGEAAEIRSPAATRPWQHVLEPLSGYLLLGARLFASPAEDGEAGRRGFFAGFSLAGAAFNFGPSADAAQTVADVTRALQEAWPGFATRMNPAAACGMKESTLLKLCCDKALAYLNWRATLDFDLTMRFTAAWYAAYRQSTAGENIDMAAFTQRQIDAYCQLARRAGQEWSSDAIRY